MRPQDIVILLKLVAINQPMWKVADVARSLKISLSEVSESLNRSKQARLLDQTKKRVMRQKLMEFIRYGLTYVYPTYPGHTVKGIPTAHSHPFMQQRLVSSAPYVWRDPKGTARGSEIEPLYPKQIEAVKEDEQLYMLLALTDSVRLNQKRREVEIALEGLQKQILG